MAAAVGTVTNSGNAKRSICAMVAQAATNAAPASATAGVPSYPIAGLPVDNGAFYSGVAPDESVLSLWSSAGSGAISGTFILWGFLAAGSAGVSGPNGGAGQWVQIATINSGAISGTAPLTFSQNLPYLGAYDRLYLQCSAISGTSAAFEAWLTTFRAVTGRA